MSLYAGIGAAEAFVDRAVRLNIPATVTFQITDRCNYRCAHCYETHEDRDELTTFEIKDVLSQLAAMGVLFLGITGGEVYMRRDLDEILAYARELRFAIRLLTTGHFIDDQRAARLKELAIQEVHISLYGADAETHELVTQMPGSFERSVAAIRRLRAHDVFVVVKSPVMSVNIHKWKALRELVEELGCAYTMDPKVTSREDGDKSPLHLRASSGELLDFYSEFSEQTPGRAPDVSQPFDYQARNLGSPCRIAATGCSINPQGKVFGCVSMPVAGGDLRKERFEDIWRGSTKFAQLRGIKWGDIAVCNECELRPFCNRCHAMALLEDGNMLGPSKEACRHAVAQRESFRARGLIPADTSSALPVPLQGEAMPAPPRRTEKLAYGFRPSALRVIG